MWHRFTERARRVVFFATEEVERLGRIEVEPHHLLFGLLQESECVACGILRKLAVSPAPILEVIATIEPQSSGSPCQDTHLTAAGRQTIEDAYQASRLIGHNYIGTEHLLLGLLTNQDSMCNQLLGQHGVDFDRVMHVLKHEATEGDCMTLAGLFRFDCKQRERNLLAAGVAFSGLTKVLRQAVCTALGQDVTAETIIKIVPHDERTGLVITLIELGGEICTNYCE